VGALGTRGGKLAVAAAAILVIVIALAAGGAFNGCRGPATDTGRPSAAVSDSPFGGVAWAAAKVLAQNVGRRPADSWGEIHAREFITGALQQYGYFPLTQEFIATGSRGRVHSANIVALKEGASPKRLIIGAHYDSAAASRGYTDNATGVGLLLEIAGRLRKNPTPYTLVFVAFGAEEDGDLGSSYYLRHMSKVERSAVLGMIDLDAPAGGDQLSVVTRLGGATWLRDDALSAAGQLHVRLVTSPKAPGRKAGTVSAPTDDLPFANVDIPTAVFSAVSWKASKDGHLAQTWPGPSMWNTPQDAVAYVDKKYPGRVRGQLRDLSRLLELLLTSKLGRNP
jgi:alkaline phosphatase isozyme conversion protein